MASTYLTRTTGTPTLGTKCTVSVWVKISEVPSGGGSDRWIFGEYGNGSNHSYLYLRNSSEIGWYEADGSGTVASAVTFNSATSLTVTTNLAAGSYFVRVENNDGGAVRSSSAILAVSLAPVWSTGAGSLGTISAGATQSFTLLAYDDDSTAVTSYSLQSGSLPGGFTLDGDSSIGTISGTETGSTATTTYSFTIRATDNESQTTDRAFTITVSHGASGGGQFN